MAVRRSVTEVGRYIGEIIDQVLRGEVIQVTRYGRVICEFTSEIPSNGREISVTDFVSTVGHWTSLVEAERTTLVITRRDRPVVALRPFESQIGGFVEHRA